MAAAVGNDPDLEYPGVAILQIIFRMPDARARRHHLNVARLGTAFIPQIIAMGNRAFAHIGDDFHIVVRVGRKAGSGRDDVIIPHAQTAPVGALGIVIVRKGKMMPGLKPAVVGGAQSGEGTVFDHLNFSSVYGIAVR